MARRSMRRTKHQIPTTETVYSTVEPTREEKLLLPRKFRKADEWPVTSIIDVKEGKYLVDWEPHPITGERWKPEWRKSVDISDDLITSWQEQTRATEILKQKRLGGTITSGRPQRIVTRSRRRRLINPTRPSEGPGPTDTTAFSPLFYPQKELEESNAALNARTGMSPIQTPGPNGGTRQPSPVSTRRCKKYGMIE